MREREGEGTPKVHPDGDVHSGDAPTEGEQKTSVRSERRLRMRGEDNHHENAQSHQRDPRSGLDAWV